MCVMILNYLDKKSMYVGLYKTPNKALSCLVLSTKEWVYRDCPRDKVLGTLRSDK